MANKNFSTKEFNEVVKGAKVELNGIFKSPFVVVNLLNKAAKGDYSKIDGCNIGKENLSKVAKVLKSMHNGRYAFDLDLLTKDNQGRFVSVATSKNVPIWDYQLIDILPNKGYKYYKPLACTINSIFAAFAKVAKVEISDNEKAAKESQKAAAKADRIKAAKLRDLDKAFDKGILTEMEYKNKLAAIKAA